RLGLLIGILGEVAQDDDDLVFDIDGRVAVVSEVLRLGNDNAVSGESDWPFDFRIVGERKRLDVGAFLKRRRGWQRACAGRATFDAYDRAAILAARGELE